MKELEIRGKYNTNLKFTRISKVYVNALQDYKLQL